MVEPDKALDTHKEAKKYQTSIEFADRAKQVYQARTYFYESEAQCDRNMEIFIKCIDSVSDTTNKEGLAAVKLTALGRPQFLLQMSEFLVQLQALFQTLIPEAHNYYNSPDDGKFRGLDSQQFQNRLDELGIQIDYDERKEWFTLLDTSGDG